MDSNLLLKVTVLVTAIALIIIMIVGNLIKHRNYITMPMQGIVELWCSSEHTLYLVSPTDISPLLSSDGKPKICEAQVVP